ncbi:MAG: hypothetical protein LC799_31170, partial [Actinobacteria bacterium]|nr:hypothetical protein [Actinomycetota bacterium]
MFTARGHQPAQRHAPGCAAPNGERIWWFSDGDEFGEWVVEPFAGLSDGARPEPAVVGADAVYPAGHHGGQEARIPSAGGAKRIAPLWRLLGGIAENDWADAINMHGAQVAVAQYCPDWWPAATRLLIRRVRLDIDAGQVCADPRARHRRTLRPEQRVLAITELAEADTVYGYSFVVTNLDVSTPQRAAAVEHWYRHRTQVENILCATRRPVIS